MLVVSVENVDVPILHANVDEAVVILLVTLLVRQERRRVKTADLTGGRVGFRHLQLHLAVVQVLHLPQLEHVGDVDGDKKTAVRDECQMANFVVVRVVNFLLVSFE